MLKICSGRATDVYDFALALQWVNNLATFKSACEDVYIAAGKWIPRKSTSVIKQQYDGFSGWEEGRRCDMQG